MGFKFRKSVKIAPGVKLNFNKKSTGITFGGKGVHYTINSKGKRTKSVGIPGTGLYYSTSSAGSKSRSKKTTVTNTENFGKEENINMTDKKWYQKNWVIALLIIYFFPVGLYLMWKHTNWKKGVKMLITSIFAFYLLLFCVGFSSVSDIEPTTNVDSIIASSTTETTTETTTEEITTTETTTTETTTEEVTTTKKITTTQATTVTTTRETTEETTEEEEYYNYYEEDEEEEESEMVWITATGSKYHSIPYCGNTKSSRQVSLETAKRNYSACSKCW